MPANLPVSPKSTTANTSVRFKGDVLLAQLHEGIARTLFGIAANNNKKNKSFVWQRTLPNGVLIHCSQTRNGDSVITITAESGGCKLDIRGFYIHNSLYILDDPSVDTADYHWDKVGSNITKVDRNFTSYSYHEKFSHGHFSMYIDNQVKNFRTRFMYPNTPRLLKSVEGPYGVGSIATIPNIPDTGDGGWYQYPTYKLRDVTSVSGVSVHEHFTPMEISFGNKILMSQADKSTTVQPNPPEYVSLSNAAFLQFEGAFGFTSTVEDRYVKIYRLEVEEIDDQLREIDEINFSMTTIVVDVCAKNKVNGPAGTDCFSEDGSVTKFPFSITAPTLPEAQPIDRLVYLGVAQNVNWDSSNKKGVFLLKQSVCRAYTDNPDFYKTYGSIVRVIEVEIQVDPGSGKEIPIFTEANVSYTGTEPPGLAIPETIDKHKDIDYSGTGSKTTVDGGYYRGYTSEANTTNHYFRNYYEKQESAYNAQPADYVMSAGYYNDELNYVRVKIDIVDKEFLEEFTWDDTKDEWYTENESIVYDPEYSKTGVYDGGSVRTVNMVQHFLVPTYKVEIYDNFGPITSYQNITDQSCVITSKWDIETVVYTGTGTDGWPTKGEYTSKFDETYENVGFIKGTSFQQHHMDPSTRTYVFELQDFECTRTSYGEGPLAQDDDGHLYIDAEITSVCPVKWKNMFYLQHDGAELYQYLKEDYEQDLPHYKLPNVYFYVVPGEPDWFQGTDAHIWDYDSWDDNPPSTEDPCYIDGAGDEVCVYTNDGTRIAYRDQTTNNTDNKVVIPETLWLAAYTMNEIKYLGVFTYGVANPGPLGDRFARLLIGVEITALQINEYSKRVEYGCRFQFNSDFDVHGIQDYMDSGSDGSSKTTDTFKNVIKFGDGHMAFILSLPLSATDPNLFASVLEDTEKYCILLFDDGTVVNLLDENELMALGISADDARNLTRASDTTYRGVPVWNQYAGI